MSAQFLRRVAFVAILSALAAPAFAANLFPDTYYYSVNTALYLVPPATPGAPPAGGLVTLEGLILTSPAAAIAPPAAPGTSVWGVGTSFSAQTYMSFFGGPTLPSFNLGDPASASITGILDAPPTHTYTTEMLSLNLSGLPFSALIRESPTIASTGGHTVIDTPFHIDSFFDVFTELSLDGGANWIPSTGPLHMQNPEPGSLALLASSVTLLICRRRCRH